MLSFCYCTTPSYLSQHACTCHYCSLRNLKKERIEMEVFVPKFQWNRGGGILPYVWNRYRKKRICLSCLLERCDFFSTTQFARIFVLMLFSMLALQIHLYVLKPRYREKSIHCCCPIQFSLFLFYYS